MNLSIPVNEPLIGIKEKEYLSDCLKTGWISSVGKYIDLFETNWAKFCGKKYGIAVSNGTAALQLAVDSLNLSTGDEVIMPSFSIISCVLAVVRNKAVPVLVDCDPDTWTMDVNQIEKKITNKTKAIMPVHIYGHPVDMDPVLKIAKKHNLAIIEDAAEAHGSQYYSKINTAKGKWEKCGSFGTLSIFSFYANKPVTTGEGGMVLTNDEKLAERLKSLRNLCFLPNRRFCHEDLGYNFRLTNLQAALGVAQIERIDKIIAKKRWIGKQYNKQLMGLPLQLPSEKPWAKNIYWMYGVVLLDKYNLGARITMARMKEKGIETRPFFVGMHEQPVFKKMELFIREKYPTTERISRKGFYLPSGLSLTTAQIDYVTQSLREILS